MSTRAMTLRRFLGRAGRLGITMLCLLTLCERAAVASEWDAISISNNIRERHMPFGVVVDPVYASPDSDEIVSYTHCGDSAIWTGHYLAAEAFRYAVTGSGDALDNV